MLYTVSEVAEMLKTSKNHVTDLFRNEPGVINLGTQERTHRRGKALLRIPDQVLARVLKQREKV